jgi:hypothetical protein
MRSFGMSLHSRYRPSPNRAFAPAAAGVELLDAGAVQAQRKEGVVEDFDRRVGIAKVRSEAHHVI